MFQKKNSILFKVQKRILKGGDYVTLEVLKLMSAHELLALNKEFGIEVIIENGEITDFLASDSEN